MKRLLSTLLLGALCGWLPVGRALTATEAADLLFLKQEEKLARDVYQTLGALWNHRTFANIAVSEQRHMDALDTLITRNRLSDPTPAEAGKFSIPELQDLYDDLVAVGSESLEQALTVGVTVEETDIDDIEEMLLTVRDAAFRRVLTNLRNGSLNHLEAFNAALDPLEAVVTTPTASASAGAACDGTPSTGARSRGAPGQRRGR